MRRLLAVGLIAVGLAFGCGDDEGGAADASVDTAVGSDATSDGTTSDGTTSDGTTSDGTTSDGTTSDGEAAKSCLLISFCKQDCTAPETAIACAAECQTQGCDAARTAATALQDCTLEHCETECADPSAGGCVVCAQASCAVETIACLAATCL